jgi:hypothetical protein
LAVGDRPLPFTALEHEFSTFEAVLQWLGNPEARERRAA